MKKKESGEGRGKQMETDEMIENIKSRRRVGVLERWSGTKRRRERFKNEDEEERGRGGTDGREMKDA